MRHTLTTQITIDARPEDVWATLVDLDRYREWNPFVVSASGDVEVGHQIAIELRPPGRRMLTLRPTITTVEAERALTWLGHVGIPGLIDGEHWFTLQAAGTGTTLTHGETFSGALVRLLRRSLTAQTSPGLEAMNVALKQRVERSAR